MEPKVPNVEATCPQEPWPGTNISLLVVAFVFIAPNPGTEAPAGEASGKRLELWLLLLKAVSKKDAKSAKGNVADLFEVVVPVELLPPSASPIPPLVLDCEELVVVAAVTTAVPAFVPLLLSPPLR